MDYMCKDCDSNNHGWCKKRKLQNLKSITDCNVKTVNGVEIQQESKVNELNSEAYKSYGKRDNFYNIQRQIIAMEQSGEKSITIEELKKLMIGIDQGLEISETIHGIAFDYEIDRDIYEDSKRITSSWRSQLKI